MPDRHYAGWVWGRVEAVDLDLDRTAKTVRCRVIDDTDKADFVDSLCMWYFQSNSVQQ